HRSMVAWMGPKRRSAAMAQNQADMGTDFWRDANLVDAYDRTDLRPVEAVLLDRYSEALGGRGVELGGGAGRGRALRSVQRGIGWSRARARRRGRSRHALSVQVGLRAPGHRYLECDGP